MKTSLQRALALSSVIGLLLGAGVATDASADDQPAWERTILVPTGTPTLSGISGRAGHLKLANVEQRAFLRGIVNSERGDKPCFTRVDYWYEHALSPRNPERTQEGATAAVDECSEHEGSRRWAHIYGAGWRQQDGSGRGVAGVQVCLNKKRTRVKGIRLLGARISPDGTVLHSSAYDRTFERPNCHTPWEPVKRCADDRVATGVHLHHNGSSLVGIELECQKVEVRQLATR